METNYFIITPGRYVRVAAGEWFSRRWPIVILPVGACLIAGLLEPLFWFAALFLIFIIIPAILAIVYLDYALRPIAAFSTIRHRVIADDTTLTIEYSPLDEDRPIPKPLSIPTADITRTEDTGDFLIIHLRTRHPGFILIPISALSKSAYTFFEKNTQKILQFQK